MWLYHQTPYGDILMSHDNVTDIRKSVSPFPNDSTLYFPVVEREDGWCDKHGQWHRDPSLKKLLRMDSNNRPHILSTVGTGYKVVQNRELFPHIEQKMQSAFEPRLLRDVETRDEWSYDGRDCWRHYTFPNLRCDIDGGGDVAFRLIVGNSYGGKSVQLIAGAIDFFCTNGMIIGTHEKQARKHTSGLTIGGIATWINDSVTAFTKHTQRCNEWSDMTVPLTREDDLFMHLVEKNLVSQQRASKLNEEMHYERNRRVGRDNRPTVWHLYSASTAWASHGDIRDTGNDHAANTRIDRARHALRIGTTAADFVRKAA